MKKLIVVLFLIPGFMFAQKPVKPNLNKAKKDWAAGKIAEAKTMIDIVVTDPKLSLDGESWYYRGLIYATIDTSANDAVKALDANAYSTYVESFKKADGLTKAGKEYFVTDANFNITTKSQQMLILANYYLNKGATAFQNDDKDGALINFEKTQSVLPDDTTAYYYAALVANEAENWEKAEANVNKFFEKGGKTRDAHLILYQIYNGPKDNKEKALEIIRKAKAALPKDPDFPKMEIGLLIDLKQIDAAKKGLEDELVKDPNNKILHFYLGYVNQNLGNNDVAKSNYEAAIKIDPVYFDARLFLAKLVYNDAATVKKEMSGLGISDKDKKRMLELDKVYVEKLKHALPYWEQCEQIKPDDTDVLDALYSIYSDLGADDKVKRIEKRYKELGLDN